MCSAAESKYVRQNVTAANSPPPPPATFNVPVAAVQYLNADGLATGRGRGGYAAAPPFNNNTKRRSNAAVSLQTIVLTFSVLMCVFSCLLTVVLTYKWHMDTNRQVDRLVGTVQTRVQTVLLDLNTLTEIVRNELVSKRLNVGPPSKDNDGGGGGGDSVKDYEDDFDDNDENRFMGKELLANSWPTKRSSSSYRSDEQPDTSDDRRRRRRRRAAEIGPTKIKNDLNGSNNPKSDVELIEKNNEENTVRTNNRRKPKKMGVGKKNPVEEQEDEDTYEDIKDMTEIVAAHFTSDSSKYNTKTHMHYHGNGRLKHPDGDYRDWSQKLWDINLASGNPNQNNFQMKNGRVEIIKPGLYFVYAQIFYSDTHDINGYYIMQNNEQMFGCTTTRHQHNQSDSCYTGGLMNLNAKDTISIKGLDEERYIILDPVKSFFGLFKVSKDNRR